MLRPIMAILVREIYTCWKVQMPLYLSSPEDCQDRPKHVVSSNMEVLKENCGVGIELHVRNGIYLRSLNP
jgi:hypothetical protein